MYSSISLFLVVSTNGVQSISYLERLVCDMKYYVSSDTHSLTTDRPGPSEISVVRLRCLETVRYEFLYSESTIPVDRKQLHIVNEIHQRACDRC